MAKTEKDARLIEYKDTISQLNMTIKSQNEIILSLKETIASNQEQMRIMTEKIDYLSNKLFGTSSEKTKNLEGQYSLFDEAEQEAMPTDESEIAESVPVKEYTRKAKSKQSDIFKGVPSRDEIPRAGSTDTTQLCNRICGGLGYVSKVCKLHAPVPTGTGLETNGSPA